MSRAADEQRARELYEQRDADAAWTQAWSPQNRLARFVSTRHDVWLERAVHSLEPELGPASRWRVLEVGCGGGGQLPFLRDVIGIPETALAGIDLLDSRVDGARRTLPAADLRAGSAADLPWADASFDVVVASTLFSSVLDPELRSSIATECLRVLGPGGSILWYDMRDDFLAASFFRRLAKPAEHWLGRRELTHLFPECDLRLRPATLFLPLARPLVRFSPRIASFAEDVLPFLRGHYQGIITKPGTRVGSRS